MIIGCAGGGSNLGGLISPFAGQMLRGEADYKLIAVEPASCPSLTRGKYAYDFCDTGKVCPLAKMYTLGSGFIPSANHAGGLRYHGMSSVVSELYDQGLIEARSVEQTEVFKAAEQFARIEGILPAPESSHAIKGQLMKHSSAKKPVKKRILYSDLQVQATSICLHISVITTMKCQITFRQTKNCKVTVYPSCSRVGVSV